MPWAESLIRYFSPPSHNTLPSPPSLPPPPLHLSTAYDAQHASPRNSRSTRTRRVVVVEPTSTQAAVKHPMSPIHDYLVRLYERDPRGFRSSSSGSRSSGSSGSAAGANRGTGALRGSSSSSGSSNSGSSSGSSSRRIPSSASLPLMPVEHRLRSSQLDPRAPLPPNPPAAVQGGSSPKASSLLDASTVEGDDRSSAEDLRMERDTARIAMGVWED